MMILWEKDWQKNQISFIWNTAAREIQQLAFIV